ncbi:hypothetical protein EZS27_014166 [termite gut metagenome]|uniref:Uncharacterized protein n=1 Tax=termite gut metagenome TaxID=433724 RepID=A0A5J4RXR7_9ZZZZ
MKCIANVKCTPKVGQKTFGVHFRTLFAELLFGFWKRKGNETDAESMLFMHILKIDALITFNGKDFSDICHQRKIELIGMNYIG